MPDKEKKTVSATQISALFDKSPYDTHWTLYQWFKGNLDDDDGDGRMRWGKLMQPLVLQECAKELRLEVEANPEDHYIRRGPLGCTRDADIIAPDKGRGALETKCCFDYRTWMDRWSGGKRPPVDLELQLQAQMYVGDGEKPFAWGIIAVWLAGEIHYFERTPDAKVFALMEEGATAFLAKVAAGEEPDPFGSPLEIPLLKEIYPEVLDEDPLVIEPGQAGDALEEEARMLAWSQREKSSHENNKKNYEAKFLALLKDKGEIEFPNGTRLFVTKSTIKPGSIVTQEMVGKPQKKGYVRTVVKVLEPAEGYDTAIKVNKEIKG